MTDLDVNVFEQPEEARLRDTLAKLVTHCITLGDALDAAYEQQWSPRTPRTIEEQSSRDGQPNDPTGDIAVDPLRLQLREAVVEAEHVLSQAVHAVQVANFRVNLRLADKGHAQDEG